MTSLFIILTLIGMAVCSLLFIPALQLRKATGHASFMKPALSSLFVFIGGLLLYSTIGSPKILPKLGEHESYSDELHTAIEGINAAIKERPEDASLYGDLGKAYMALQDYREAQAAFKGAVLLSNGNPEYIMALGRAEMGLAGGEVNEAARKAFEMVVMQDKENLMARYYLALGKKHAGDIAGANKDFEFLLKELPDGIPLRGMIQREMQAE